jgi:type II restriction/modification system DNA methylase subunit YeeA
MTPEKFITTWKSNKLSERAGAQSHFDDLCDLLKVEKPRDPENYCFERGAIKDSGKDGWADVWKRDHFGWENKKPGRDLTKALAQLREYAGNLGNPPLLIVCDRDRIEIHTAFRGYPDEPRTILLQDIADLENQQLLRWVFTDPDKLRPLNSNAAITDKAAGQFALIAKAMRERGIDPQQVAHFLTQCIFCMFAEDEGLLHRSPTEDSEIFTALLKAARTDPKKAEIRIKSLFTAMQKKGGQYGNDDIAWFNGGLFKIIDVPPLIESDLSILYQAAASIDWRAIDPTIFGTLFERGLDPSNRAQLGAHYTDVATINKLIDPLITRPLSAEWEAAKTEIAKLLLKSGKTTKSKNYKDAQNLYYGYLERLRNFRVLDAACGSGNFLYLALHALKDLEHRAQLDSEIFGFGKQLTIEAGTDNILGIEINEYAAELARITVWIGEIQWCQRNGRPINNNPILHSLEGIQHRDALLNEDGSEAQWPAADVIVGNPPFLGDKMMRGELGDDYVTTLRNRYKGRVPGGADLVCYWFDKARLQIEHGKTKAAGFVSTNSIRGGSNRMVLDNICQTLPIFEAWSDENWFDAGTAVRVSLVCFGDSGLATILLANENVALIHTDLTAGSGEENTDITKAKILSENAGTAFIGTQKSGPFDLPGETARQWLNQPNPHSKANSGVVKPWANGMDVTRRPSDTWVIDFGVDMSETDACLFELPFKHLETFTKSSRIGKREIAASRWWLHTRPRPELRKRLIGLERFIATPRVSKHRFFVWLPITVVPDTRLTVNVRADDTNFGILNSRFHELWSLATCSWHGVGNDPTYNAISCFETFPFPEGLSPKDTTPKSESEKSAMGYLSVLAESLNGSAITPVIPFSQPTPAIITDVTQRPHAQAIANSAFNLNKLRNNWLNPPEWVDWVITPEEETAGFPKRPVAKPGHEIELKKRTLTNLYNLKPQWLNNAHQILDKAVASAYGWDDYTPEMSDAEILQRLLKLNLAYNKTQQTPPPKPAIKPSKAAKKQS